MMLLLMLMNHVLHLSFLNGIMAGDRAGDHSRVNISQSVTFSLLQNTEGSVYCLIIDLLSIIH